MKQLITNIVIIFTVITGIFTACDNDDKPTFPETQQTYEIKSGFAKGADIGWLTEMENAGRKFYNADGQEKECIKLMREIGMNAIRLRVWVDPSDGWCNESDVLVKALRAHNLGMRLMINFHYSDSWADPGKQDIPSSWQEMELDEMKKAVSSHTTKVLTRLKENGLDVEWVQVGNETRTGMLWPLGKATSGNMKNYAELNNAGYDAVKAVYPDAKVLVHVDHGHDNGISKWLFEGLKNDGGKWDVIGLSLYPDADNWQEMNNNCIENVKDIIQRFGCEVIICEVGMHRDEAETGKKFLSDLLDKCKAIPDNKCGGIFYWEPQAYGSWKSYSKGAFDSSGKPTIALDPFLD